MKKNILGIPANQIIGLLVMLLIILVGMNGIGKMVFRAGESQVVTMEEALRRAAILCYALEGSYPEDLDYLKEHYGIVLNEQKYFYHYEIVASNLLPDIKVIEK